MFLPPPQIRDNLHRFWEEVNPGLCLKYDALDWTTCLAHSEKIEIAKLTPRQRRQRIKEEMKKRVRRRQCHHSQISKCFQVEDQSDGSMKVGGSHKPRPSLTEAEGETAFGRYIRFRAAFDLLFERGLVT